MDQIKIACVQLSVAEENDDDAEAGDHDDEDGQNDWPLVSAVLKVLIPSHYFFVGQTNPQCSEEHPTEHLDRVDEEDEVEFCFDFGLEGDDDQLVNKVNHGK